MDINLSDKRANVVKRIANVALADAIGLISMGEHYYSNPAHFEEAVRNLFDCCKILRCDPRAAIKKRFKSSFISEEDKKALNEFLEDLETHLKLHNKIKND